MADRLFLDPARLPIPAADIVATSGIPFLFGREQIGFSLSAGLARDPDVYFPFAYAESDPAYLFSSCLAIEQLLAGQPYVRRNSLAPALYPMRMVKDDTEKALLALAAEATGRGVLAGMAAVRPGLLESDLQGVIEAEFLAGGASGTSFPSIVGSGPNSLILHYEENTRRMGAGEVVVVDVGAELGCYAGDITRTLPVSGVFTARQREVYDVVLECQRRAIAACRPYTMAISGLDTAAKAYAVEKGYGAAFNFSGWRHGTSHSLGLDVHDPIYKQTLVPGMVITIEPGIYLPDENLGIRIEDDVLITATGCVVLTDGVPRTADDVEAAIAGVWTPSSPGSIRRGAFGGPPRLRAVR